MKRFPVLYRVVQLDDLQAIQLGDIGNHFYIQLRPINMPMAGPCKYDLVIEKRSPVFVVKSGVKRDDIVTLWYEQKKTSIFVRVEKATPMQVLEFRKKYKPGVQFPYLTVSPVLTINTFTDVPKTINNLFIRLESNKSTDEIKGNKNVF